MLHYTLHITYSNSFITCITLIYENILSVTHHLTKLALWHTWSNKVAGCPLELSNERIVDQSVTDSSAHDFHWGYISFCNCIKVNISHSFLLKIINSPCFLELRLLPRRVWLRAPVLLQACSEGEWWSAERVLQCCSHCTLGNLEQPGRQSFH